jgi:hypothetical protein
MEDKQYLWDSFARLGEMMGDGLHHEEDGKWIVKEYNRLSRILCPEMYQEIRQNKAKVLNEAMKKFLAEKRCPCGGELQQTRSGTRACKCARCGKKYHAVKAKK